MTTTAIGPNTIPGLAEKNADLSTLVTALQAAGLVDTLAGSRAFTVFAPTNEAFAALPPAELKYLLNNKTALTAVLEYHVASGKVLSSDLYNGEEIKTLEGENVTVTIIKTSTGTTVKIDDATVKTANVEASNGVVHIIDKVMIPPGFAAPTIPQLAAAANLTTLVAAVTAAKLGATLSGAGPFTVFAPTNEAFAALPPGVLTALLKPANIADLVKVLEYHVVSREVLSTDLKNGEQIKTLEGQEVNVTIAGSDVSINDAKVKEANVFAVNGVVHVIDAVLLPPGFTPPSDQRGGDTTMTTTAIGPNTIPGLAEKNADLSTLVTALQAAGLVDTLAGSGPFTVFAPTNEAFAALPPAELKYLLNNKTALTAVLEYHVASGKVLSNDLYNGEEIKTLEGENVTVTITKTSTGTTVKIDDATVKTA